MFRPLFFAAAFSALVLPAACFAQSQTPPPASAPASGDENTLNLTLQTGPASAPNTTPTTQTSTTATPRRIFITNVKQPGDGLPQIGQTNQLSSRALSALASRSTGYDRDALQQKPSQAPTVTATLGLVVPAQANLRLSRANTSRLLNVVHKGTYLAVVADGGTHWGSAYGQQHDGMDCQIRSAND